MTKTTWFFVLPLILQVSSIAQTPQWRLVPSTAELRIGAIGIFHGNPDTLYAVSDIGLLLSTNNGELWDTVAGGELIRFGILNAVKVDPFDSKRVYVSHMHPFQGSNDISMTTDAGATWRLIGEGGGLGRGAVIEIDPFDHRTVYLGIGDFGDASTIKRTTDHGATWLFRPEPAGSFSIYSIAIDPSDRSVMCAAYHFGFYKSLDTGATWTTMDLGIPVRSDTRVLIHPVTRAIYATTWPYLSNPGGVFRSTDLGQTWVEMNNGLGPNNRYIFWIAVNPARTNEMFLCTSTPTSSPEDLLFFSSDTGLTWSPLSWGLPRRGHTEQLVIDTLNNRLFTSVLTPTDSLGVYVLDIQTSSDEQPSVLPGDFHVFQNYPNPFNNSTAIDIDMSTSETVRVEIFDLVGRRVSTLAEEFFKSGRHRFLWHAGHVSSGVYVCRVTTAHRVKSILMTVIK